MTYLAEPTLKTMRIRGVFGACLLCGTAASACTCRYCDGCARFWDSGAEAYRAEHAERLHGIVTEDCPDCAAWTRAFAFNMENAK